MPLIKITRSGLAAIACSVALLWACILCEQIVTRRARAGQAEAIRCIERLQNKQHPSQITVPSTRPRQGRYNDGVKAPRELPRLRPA